MSLAFADEFKKKGNAFYKLQNFVKANEAYTKALKSIKHDHAHDNHVLASLHSNRANSFFELGDYEGAAQDSRIVIHELQHTGDDTDENRHKIEMNKWRLVRCLFYLKADKSALNDIISTITDPSLQQKCKKILDSIDCAEKINEN